MTESDVLSVPRGGTQFLPQPYPGHCRPVNFAPAFGHLFFDSDPPSKWIYSYFFIFRTFKKN